MSCKKQTFDHSDESVNTPDTCNCCDLADSIEGVYLGQLREYEYTNLDPNNIQYNVITDTTLTIHITRNWDNDFTDSLVCKFNIPYLFNYEIRFDDNSGNFYEPHIYQNQKFYYSGSDLKLHVSNSHYVNPVLSVTTLTFTGTKQ